MFAEWRQPTGFLERMDAPFFAPEHVALDERLDSTTIATHLGLHLHRVFKGAFYVLASEYASAGVPFIRVADITSGEVDLGRATYLPPDVHAREAKTAVRPGDLLFAKGGSIGNSAVVPARIVEANISQDVIGARVRRTLDAYFAQAFLSSALGVQQMVRWAQGNVHPHITNDAVRNVRIPLPRVKIQRAIGNKLRKAERLRELAAAARAQADKVIDRLMQFGIASQHFHNHGWRPKGSVDQERLDAWFHRPEYVWRAEVLASQQGLRSIRSVCAYTAKAANVRKWPSPAFDYFEIGGIDPTTGEALSNPVHLEDAPSRAKYLVHAGDLLVSTVRPNLKKVGQVDPHRVGPGVATSGFSVWRPPTPEIGAYLRACLVHEVGVSQMMRWNTGGTYPAIDADVPGRVLVPYDEEQAQEVGSDLLKALVRVQEAGTRVESAHSAVEALVDGTLDEAALVAESDAIERWLAEHPSPFPGA